MLAASVALNRNVSCGTKPICRRNSAGSRLLQIDSVQQHRAAGGVEQPRQQVHQGALARAGMAHDGERGPGRNAQVDSVRGRGPLP